MVKKFKILVLVLILLLLFNTGAWANDKLKISGSVKSDLIGDHNGGSLTDQERINVILEKEFGLDADVYVDLEFNSYTIDQTATHQRTTETNVNEAYVNYYTKKIDWRLGKQKINWGSAYKLKPTDYFNPYDLTVLKPLDNKVGVKAVKGIYYAPKGLEVTGVVIPFFKTHRVKGNQTASYQVVPVEDEVDNIQGGIKVTKRSFEGFDLSGSIYHGRDKEPIMNSQVGKLVYPEANQIGLDIIGDITEQDIGIWTEIAYSVYEDDQFDNRVKTAVGLDYNFENDLYLVGQTYYQQSRIDNKEEIKMVNIHADQPIFDFHEWEVTTFYEFESETFSFEPQFNYSLSNSTELQIGGTYVESDSKEDISIISSLSDDRIYARVEVEF